MKVDATGLEPGTTYYYRFRGLGETSADRPHEDRADRRLAAPLRGRLVLEPTRTGYFHVYRAIAERRDIDAVIHLGDYIYEYGDGEYGDDATRRSRRTRS